MRESTTAWLSAIGSISTGLAAVIALIAIIITIRSNSADRERTSAAEVRRNLSMLAQESEVLSRLLDDGSPLIVGSRHITKELEARLGPTPTPDTLWAHLRNDKPMMLSVAITGWSWSELSKRIDDLLANLRRISVGLYGQVSLLRYPVELYDGIANDAYSGMIFFRMLTDANHILLQDERNEKSVPEILSALAGELQSNAAAYYAACYQEVSTDIDAFRSTCGSLSVPTQ